MDLEKLGRSLTLQRAAASGKQVAGHEGSASTDQLAQTVSGLEVTKEGVITHQAFTLKPPTMAPGQTVVEVIEASKVNFDLAVHTLGLLDDAGITVAPAIIAKSLQNSIHIDTTMREVGRFTQGTEENKEEPDSDEFKALVPVNLRAIPVEYFNVNKDYIILSQDVSSLRDERASVDSDREALEDSKLPATLSEINSEEPHGRYIVIIKAAPEAMKLNPELNPTLIETSGGQLPGQTEEIGQSSNEASVSVVGGDKGMFIPQKASYVWAPEAQANVKENNVVTEATQVANTYQETHPIYNVLDEAAAVASAAEAKNPLPATPITSDNSFITSKVQPGHMEIMPGSLVAVGDKKIDNT